MWSIDWIKQRGRVAFKQNYLPCVIVAFVMGLLVAGSSAASGSASTSANSQSLEETMSTMTPNQQAAVAGAVTGTIIVIAIVSLLLRIFVFNAISVGGCRFFRKNVEDPNTSISVVLEGFNDYGRMFITMLLRDVIIGIGTMLFVIPGIMLAYSFRMVPYLLKEYPELSPTEILARSRAIMKGNRWRSFLMDISFIGWYLLGFITLNLGNILWTNPYAKSANAALFIELDQAQRR